jgi:hypothetical protein
MKPRYSQPRTGGAHEVIYARFPQQRQVAVNEGQHLNVLERSHTARTSAVTIALFHGGEWSEYQGVAERPINLKRLGMTHQALEETIATVFSQIGLNPNMVHARELQDGLSQVSMPAAFRHENLPRMMRAYQAAVEHAGREQER